MKLNNDSINPLINYQGHVYSVSVKNEIGEYVVVKLKPGLTEGYEIQEARIIKAGSFKKVRNIILNGGFTNGRILEGSILDKVENELLN